MKVSELGFHILDAEISRVQKHLSTLQKQRARCEAHTKKLRIAVAPHKYLPPEILAEVFLHCLYHDPLDGRLAILGRSPHLLPVPLVLGRVCSRWRQIAFGEKRLWNSIHYEGNLRRHVILLQEAFRHSGQSTLQLEAVESRISGLYQSFLHEVVLPQLHRITSLLLDVGGATFQDFLRLPSGLLDELECVKIQIHRGDEYSSSPQAPTTVFQGASRLRRVTIPLLNSRPWLDLTLPWGQLIYLALTYESMELTDSFKVLSLCRNLSECYLCLCPDSDSKPIPPASIQLPHLRNLGVNMSKKPAYRDYFRPLVTPKLEQFAFVLSDPSADHLKELRETIDRLYMSIPNLRLVLLYNGDRGDGILRLARSLPPLTSIKASHQRFLPASTMKLIARDVFFQTLTSLEACIHPSDTKDLVEMFKGCWTRARQSNSAYTGIRSATIVVVVSEKKISELSRVIAGIQKELGVPDAKITLRQWHSHHGRSWLF